MHVDDRDLAKAVTSGGREAFDQLVEREATAVYRTCYRILRDPSDAEDATQETFVAAYRAMSSYRGEGSLRAWLARIATRRAFALIGRRRPSESLDAAMERPVELSTEDDPQRAAEAADRRRRLLGRIASLPEAHRDVILLLYFGDRTLTEIAAVTGRPLGTVKTHLHRGLEQLRRGMVEELPR